MQFSELLWEKIRRKTLRLMVEGKVERETEERRTKKDKKRQRRTKAQPRATISK